MLDQNRQNLTIQLYLRNGGTLEGLAHDYAIKSVRHTTFPHLILLRYDQINSPMAEPLVQECRSLILDEANDWNVVARGFDKFFNVGEPLAPLIDWSTARVQEKVDGTLCIVYHYEGWQVATTGFPDARGRAQDLPITFDALIRQAIATHSLEFHSTDHTYLFELTSPHTRVVVPHQETRLTLLGIRHRTTGVWSNLEASTALLTGRIFPVKEFPLNSLEEVLTTFAVLNPLEQEGYVVVDGEGNRVKIKHPGYVALHLLKSSASPKRYVEILRQGEEWELLTYFPEIEAQFGPIREAYHSLCAEADADYMRLKEIPIQKEFAAEALRTRCSGALFSLRGGQCRNAKEYFGSRATLPGVLKLLGIKEDTAEEQATP